MRPPDVIYTEIKTARESDNPVYRLRLLCEKYTQEELHEAKNHFNCTSNDPLGMVVQEAMNRLRHKELTDRLSAIEKPHWTMTPTFWLVLAGTIFAGGTLIIAVLDLLDKNAPTSNALNPVLQAPLVIQPVPEQKLTSSKETPTNSVVAPASPTK